MWAQCAPFPRSSPQTRARTHLLMGWMTLIAGEGATAGLLASAGAAAAASALDSVTFWAFASTAECCAGLCTCRLSMRANTGLPEESCSDDNAMCGAMGKVGVGAPLRGASALQVSGTLLLYNGDSV